MKREERQEINKETKKKNEYSHTIEDAGMKDNKNLATNPNDSCH